MVKIKVGDRIKDASPHLKDDKGNPLGGIVKWVSEDGVEFHVSWDDGYQSDSDFWTLPEFVDDYGRMWLFETDE